MTYESLELVELGKAEIAIEFGLPITDEELDDKFVPSCVPYVDYEE